MCEFDTNRNLNFSLKMRQQFLISMCCVVAVFGFIKKTHNINIISRTNYTVHWKVDASFTLVYTLTHTEKEKNQFRFGFCLFQ